MKILHCADIHLDSPFRRLDDPEKKKQRKQELVLAFKQMLEDAADEKVSVVIIAGDLFDQTKVSAFSKNAVISEIKDHPEMTFYYLKGNHDKSNVFLEEENMPGNFFMFDETWTTYDLGEGIKLTGAELTYGNARTLYSELMLDMNDCNIVTLHGQESVSSAGDNTEIVSIKDLRNRNIDYLALGHIHTYKCEELDRRGHYCYPGCLESRGFDETGVHGYVILDVNGNTHEIKAVRRCSPIRRALEREVDITGLTKSADIINKMEKDISKMRISDADLLKIYLVGEVDPDCEKNLDYIDKKFSTRFYDFKLKDETKIKIDFDSYKLDKSLKGEFVRAIEADETLSEDEKKEVIKIGILALKGEEVD